MTIGDHTYSVKDILKYCQMEVRHEGGDEIYLVCEGSGRLYAMSLAEAEDIASELLCTVDHLRASQSAPQSPGAFGTISDITTPGPDAAAG
jgi:hypothetical protein